MWRGEPRIQATLHLGARATPLWVFAVTGQPAGIFKINRPGGGMCLENALQWGWGFGVAQVQSQTSWSLTPPGCRLGRLSQRPGLLGCSLFLLPWAAWPRARVGQSDNPGLNRLLLGMLFNPLGQVPQYLVSAYLSLHLINKDQRLQCCSAQEVPAKGTDWTAESEATRKQGTGRISREMSEILETAQGHLWYPHGH